MFFNSGSHLNVVGGYDDVRAGLDIRCASPLQILVDEEADEGSQSQSHSPDHQQTSTVHSAPSEQTKATILVVAERGLPLLRCAVADSY